MLTNGKLKELRQQKGYKQQYVSICTGINQSRISRFERGELSPTLEEINKILTCLGLEGNIEIKQAKYLS
jgi:transcriptional regulator with XRE-family HTH domain